jgi:hypothetical protein
VLSELVGVIIALKSSKYKSKHHQALFEETYTLQLIKIKFKIFLLMKGRIMLSVLWNFVIMIQYQE